LRKIWHAREFSTVIILVLEILFFTWFLWPSGGRSHPFFNAGNALLVLKYSSIYGIAAIGAAIVIISGGIDLSPGAVIALTGVVAGELFVDRHWGLGASATTGFLVGSACGLASAALVILVRLPPFIATLGIMGLALIFHLLMTRFQWGRAIFAIGGNETAALYSGVRVGIIQASVYLISAMLAALSGIALAIVQGQGKADLAMGYELDIIASAVVGGASLSGGRGSVIGAVLGALIFGVLRNALPQISGATFYDRLIVGLVVIVIVVMDQLLQRRKA
jgi:ribose/xylose/arabinose/galactoside ABC-type transport system permease subunit